MRIRSHQILTGRRLANYQQVYADTVEKSYLGYMPDRAGYRVRQRDCDGCTGIMREKIYAADTSEKMVSVARNKTVI